jgi:(2Fe-2S) ferredoxin
VPAFERHIFVCVNERAPTNSRGCCARKGGEAVRAEFKKQVADRGLKGIVRANKAGCLDQCERGVTVVIYPEQVWYGGVTVNDVSEIMDLHVIGGNVVERLLMPEQPHLAAERPLVKIGKNRP